MSKSNQRRIDAYHESGHAVMAWLKGITITEVRLVPDEEEGQRAATTATECPELGQWTAKDVMSHIQVTLAGPEAERFGPTRVSAREREFAVSGRKQHIVQAALYMKFGSNTIDDESGLLDSAEANVIAVFGRNYVIRCVDALARELLRRKTISGPDVEAFIAGRISEEQRRALREECLLTRAKRGRGGEESGDRVSILEEANAKDGWDFRPLLHRPCLVLTQLKRRTKQ